MSKVKKDTRNSNKPPEGGGSKVKYQVPNWSSYNQALVKRGDITIYFSDDVLDNWYSDLPTQRGAQPIYSDLCIEALLMIKAVFKLPYRQTQGFASSLLMLMGLSWLSVPCYSQICRRAGDLEVEPYQIPATGPMVIAIDSTGLKIYGEGEWKVRKHGYSKRRTWRKLHLGVDADTGFIHCHSLTANNIDDGSQLEDLVDQVEATISDVCLDGAYDHESCWDNLIEREINPVIVPRANAVEWYLEAEGDLADYARNVAIGRIAEVGKKQWKQEVGYHRRSLAETAMYRYKVIHGRRLYSRDFVRQEIETSLKVKILNIMTAQGMPMSVPIGKGQK